ncbi:hypothetical protein [Paenibacillus sp. HJGM_3]|uniref:hypothetical protein n=1 Tax=Paenibacillus sp. HJGM_3 TaxID=3379816 RepID=UPI00385BF594
MPYVARHPGSGQVWTSILTNSYKLEYYGVKYWDFEEDALAQIHAYMADQNAADADGWAVFEVEEAQLKRYNVKLKNNPQLILFTDETGLADVRRRDV